MMRFLLLSVLIFLSLAVAGCSTTPALHVIGVYEGEVPHDVNDGACNRKSGTKPSGTVYVPPLIDCKQTYIGNHGEKEVVVNVSDTSRPIVLALTAYDRTLWKVSLNRGVNLIKVILAGYHAQRVSGVPSGIPIETYTHDPSPCERCWHGADYFYSYENPPTQLRNVTDLEITSFQGRYTGSEFFIFRGLNKVE